MNAGLEPGDGLEETEVLVADMNPYVLTTTGTQQWCIDFGHDLWKIPSGDWDIHVDVAGTLNQLLIILRDSVNPGDACGVIRERGVTGPNNELVLEQMPASGEDACGQEYQDDPEDAQPFALMVWAEARGKNAQATMTMTVTVPSDGPGA